MQIHVFAIDVLGDEAAEEQLNAFLRSHRVTDVQQSLTGDGRHWTYSVRVASAAPAPSRRPPAYKSPRIDYMKELPPEEFTLFARLRDHRKALADAEGVRPYTIFTNAQLATMAKGPVATVADIEAIDGVGEARLRYADSFLAAMAEPE